MLTLMKISTPAEQAEFEAKAFKAWMVKVDEALVAKCGLCSADLPDWDYWSAWEDGASPKGAATQAYKAAGEG